MNATKTELTVLQRSTTKGSTPDNCAACSTFATHSEYLTPRTTKSARNARSATEPQQQDGACSATFSVELKSQPKPDGCLLRLVDHGHLAWTVLNADLVSSGYAYRLRTRDDLEPLQLLAQAKSKWKTLERAIVAALPAKKDPTYADTTLCRRLAKLA
ncbi:unnamed protein product [Phytophthora fragariaefolia]|uniref:Unnamed protein product n=1 Tax=Phytophthora fragariaefolia TaxID=1490495 RepID=A0A9W7D8Q4_9STRA|nr:unnamed protein product [Phytophthora fragariaefolia]